MVLDVLETIKLERYYQMKIFIRTILLVLSIFINQNSFAAIEFITDPDTKLIWQFNGQLNEEFEEAIEFCNKRPTNDRKWRLPNINELYTLVDYKGGYFRFIDILGEDNEEVTYAKDGFRQILSTKLPYWSSSVNYVNRNDTSTTRVLDFKQGGDDIVSFSYLVAPDPLIFPGSSGYSYDDPPITICVK